jgi:uncharacterized protein (DUF1499 family)
MRMKSRFVILIAATVPGACAGTVPGSGAAGAAPSRRAELACTLTTNCVDSLSAADLPPLSYRGPPGEALDRLRATLATFAEAGVVRSEPLAL